SRAARAPSSPISGSAPGLAARHRRSRASHNRLCARRAAAAAPCRCAGPRPADARCLAERRGGPNALLCLDDVLRPEERRDGGAAKRRKRAVERIRGPLMQLLQGEEDEVAGATLDLA